VRPGAHKIRSHGPLRWVGEDNAAGYSFAFEEGARGLGRTARVRDGGTVQRETQGAREHRMVLHADDEGAAVPPGPGAARDERPQRLIQPRARGGVLGRGHPCGFDAAPIGREERIGRIQVRHQSLQKPGGGRILRQPVMDPLPDAQTRQEARRAQDLQVP